MNLKGLEFENAHHRLVSEYKKIYSVVFHYSFFAILFVVGTIFFLRALSAENNNHYIESTHLVVQKTDLKWQFEQFIESNESQNIDLDISILQGTLETEGESFKSVNNLLTYKGFVMPRYIELAYTIPLFSKNQFSGDSYDVKEMKIFVYNVVFQEPKNLDEKIFKYAKIPINKSFEETFNLSCVFKWKIFQATCNHYITDFLANFFIYNVEQDYDGIQQIFNELEQRARYKTTFCDTLEKYTLYSNDTSLRLEPMFRKCGVEYIERFVTLQDFVEFQRQLDQGNVDGEVYFNSSLNTYKLFSLQQLLYTEFSKKQFHDRLLVVYLNFVQELLKKDTIDKFYKEEIYRFNNYYLRNELGNSVYLSKKEQVEFVIEELTKINKWSILVGFTGLQYQITHTELILSNSDEQTIIVPEITIQDLLVQVKNMSFFTITKEDISSTGQVYIAWYFDIPYHDEQLQLYADMNLKIEKSVLVVKNMNTPSASHIAEVVNATLQENAFTLPRTYQYLLDIVPLYFKKEETIAICDRIKSLLPQVRIQTCTDTFVELTKPIVGGKELQYLFKIRSMQIVGLRVSNDLYQVALEEQIADAQMDSFTLPWWIDQLVSFEINEESYDPQQANRLLIIEKFQNYLAVTPTNIWKDEKGFMVAFTLKETDFIALYDVAKSTIIHLYFEDIYIRPNIPLVFKNFNMILSDGNQTLINNFIFDPIIAIQSLNKNVFKAYEKYK